MDMDDAAQTRTLAHELGHVVLHEPGRTDATGATADAAMHRGIAEVEAESVALMITAAHGMDSSQYTIPYVSTWASRVPGQDPIQTVQNTAARVRSAALGILERLDTIKVPDGNPPGLDRASARLAAVEPITAVSTPQIEGVSR
jgi:antirestriction protein ArdC